MNSFLFNLCFLYPLSTQQRKFELSRKNKEEPTEGQVGEVNRPPTDETTDGRKVDQPSEHGGSTARDGHKGQEGEERLPIYSLSLQSTIPELKQYSRRKRRQSMEDHPP